MATAEGGRCIESAIAEGTFEEMDELVHDRAGIVARSGLFKDSGRDQVPHVM